MRSGKIISSTHSIINLNYGYDEDEIYKSAILNFYKDEKPPIIAPILVAKEFKDIELVSKHLTTIFGKKADIKMPKIGNKKRLIELAKINADEILNKKDENNNATLLNNIKELLNLIRVPNRIEIFDNSHLAGKATVGAMVVYENSKFDKESYRLYHLESKDEYSQMREMLTKRVNSFLKNPPPDLWLIDGGSTLLKLANDILKSNGVNIDVVAISKEKIDKKAHRAKGKADDIIHTLTDSFKLKNSDKRLQFLQNLRDEAHKSAINFHKKTKLKLDKESKLLNLKGISQAKIVKLLKYFGTFEALKEASFEQISEILNKNDAKIIKKFYN